MGGMEEPRAPEEEGIDFEPSEPPRGRPPLQTALTLALVVAALVAALLLMGRERGGEETVPPPVAEFPVQEAADPVVPAPPGGVLPAGESLEPLDEEEPAAEPVVLPGLNESDEFARRLASGVPSSWLASEELVRRFVAAVDNVAEGHSPKRHFPSITVQGKFAAVEAGGRLILDPSSYRRYDGLGDTAAAIDAAGWIRVYRTLQPLCEEAYRDLGYPDAEFDDTLRRALDRLLAVPVVEGDIVLMEQEGIYYFTDPRLEDLNAAGKHLLRMGPKNSRKIQGLLRALEAALDAHLP